MSRLRYFLEMNQGDDFTGESAPQKSVSFVLSSPLIYNRNTGWPGMINSEQFGAYLRL